MKIGGVLIVFALCVGGAIVAHVMLTPPTAHVLLEVDNSGSMNRDCAGLRKEGERMLAHAAIQSGSTLTMLGIGGGALAPEPRRLFDRPIPIESDDVFGRDDDAFAKEGKTFLSELEKSCSAAVATKNSPVLRMVTQGLAHLRSRGCAADGTCFLTVQSDLEEDVEPALRAVIQRASKRPALELPAELAGTIDNAGITVKFCGSSEVKPRAKGAHAAPATLARLWKGMFTQPDLVSFQPYCGQ